MNQWIRLFWICAAVLPIDGASAVTGPESEPQLAVDALFQTVFFAVVEGAYSDGLTSEDLATLLMREENRPYEYFVYACPLCTPTVAALELYRSRPGRFYSLKGGPNTFGSGIPPEIGGLLRGDDPNGRLEAIRLLTQRWIDAYFDSRSMSQVEIEAWRGRIEAAKKEGDRLLQGYRESGSASVAAPAFADQGDCAVCTGTFEGIVGRGAVGTGAQPSSSGMTNPAPPE